MIVFHVHVVVVLLDRMLSGRGYDRCGIPSVAQRLMHVRRKSCNRRSSIAAFSIARSKAVRMLFTGRPLRTRDRKLVARGRLKADPSTRNIPVIVTTAFSYGSLVDRAIMHKPFALKLLRAAMQRHYQPDGMSNGKKQIRDLPNGHWASRSSFQRRIILPTSIRRREKWRQQLTNL